MYYSEDKARTLIVEAGRKLLEAGLVSRTWGNISARISDEHFIITPSGRSYETLKENDLSKVKISDLSWSGVFKPSSEKGIHAACYRMHPDVAFVIHTHQFFASVLSITGESLEKAPCAGYGLPGTRRLMAEVEKAISENLKSRSFLMKNHGALILGTDYENAFDSARNLEALCTEAFHKACPSTVIENKIEVKDNQVLVTSSHVMEFIEGNKKLMPYLDDFAQIAGNCVGYKYGSQNAMLIPDKGALCKAENPDDALAVSQILQKNTAAALYAIATGLDCRLSKLDCVLQRLVYKKKYSKRKDD